MERLGALIVHGIEKVDSVLVGLVRKIRIQALTDHILHFLLSHLQRGTKAGFSKSAKTTKYRVGTGCAMDFPALFSLVQTWPQSGSTVLHPNQLGQAYCWIAERNTIWQYKFAKMCTLSCTLCLLYRPEQGNIVGRKYIKVCKLIVPFGRSLRDSTIGGLK
jgi:hypothetical protein